MMAEELRSCPFCGAKAEVWQDNVRTWGLIEHEPDCWLAYDVPRHKQEIPRAEFSSWNRRADAHVTTRNGKYRIKYGRRVPLCECCGYSIGDMRWNFCPSCGAEVTDDE